MSMYTKNKISFGPFKYIFSKTGISGSSSVNGIGLDHGPRLHHIHVSSGGAIYLSSKPSSRAPSLVSNNCLPALEMLSGSADSIVQDLNRRANRPYYWKFVLPVVLITLLMTGLSIWTLIALFFTLLAASFDKISKTSVICFTMNKQVEQDYEKLQNSFKGIMKSNSLWRIKSNTVVDNIKRNAGAAKNIERELLTTSFSCMPSVLSNIQFPTFKTTAMCFYFTPIQLIYQVEGKFTSIPYTSMKLTENDLKFVETEAVPQDAKIVDQTWKFVNLSRGPDKRYNNNPQYPVALYEQLNFTASPKFQLNILLSRLGVRSEFYRSLQKFCDVQSIVEELNLPSEPIKTLIEDLTLPESKNETSTSETTNISSLSTNKPQINIQLNASKHTVEEKFESYLLEPSQAESDITIPKAPTSFITPKAVKNTFMNGWIPYKNPVTIKNFTLTDGLIYFGEKLAGDGWNVEPALIDPKLPISSSQVDESLPLMGYWPSYSNISNEARRGYLQWLEGGRKNFNAYIGYVFLFFYGLERRAIYDLAGNENSSKDIEAILNEIKRLLSIYGHNGSFKRYGQALVNYLEAEKFIESANNQSPQQFDEPQFELPLAMKIALGQMALNKTPLSAEWAFSWVNTDVRIGKRTPANRCQTEFKELFFELYKDAYPDGIKLPVNKTKLKIAYFPATGASWRTTIKEKTVAGLPDITAVGGPVNKLQLIVDKATEALEPYSRYLGRNPDSQNTLEALLFLPLKLWHEPTRRILENLINDVRKNSVTETYSKLCERLGTDKPLPKDKLIALTQLLNLHGVGIEPDFLSGAKQPKSDDYVVLFDTPAGSDIETPAYHAATVTLDLAAAVALADGHASESELNMLKHQITSWGHLSEQHRKRLKARLEIQIRQPLSIESIKKKLEPIPQAARRSIGHLLAQLAQADGVVVKEEVKLLERIYKALQLDGQLVYSDLHSAPLSSNTNEAPALVTREKKVNTGFVLDVERIAALQKETDHVSALLANVFIDDSAPDEPEQPEISNTPDPTEESDASDLTNTILGLDNDHSSFLKFLITRPTWTREELIDVASDFELMLDGALEQINEASLDHLDDQLFEGDDPIEINQFILEKIS